MCLGRGLIDVLSHNRTAGILPAQGRGGHGGRVGRVPRERTETTGRAVSVCASAVDMAADTDQVSRVGLPTLPAAERGPARRAGGGRRRGLGGAGAGQDGGDGGGSRGSIGGGPGARDLEGPAAGRA